MSTHSDSVKIFTVGVELFKKFGIKSVTMDQISVACGISKKTLYKYVNNKSDFLLKAFSAFAALMERSLFQSVESYGGNAIDDLFAIERFAEKHIRGDEDRLIGQMERYYPDLAPILKKGRRLFLISPTAT